MNGSIKNFLVKFNKTLTVCFKCWGLLGKHASSTCIWVVQKTQREGRQSMEDNGRPCISSDKENVEKISQIVLERQLTVWLIAKALNIEQDTLWKYQYEQSLYQDDL